MFLNKFYFLLLRYWKKIFWNWLWFKDWNWKLFWGFLLNLCLVCKQWKSLMFLQGFPRFLDVVKYFNATWHSAAFLLFWKFERRWNLSRKLCGIFDCKIYKKNSSLNIFCDICPCEIFYKGCVASLIVKSTRIVLL